MSFYKEDWVQAIEDSHDGSYINHFLVTTQIRDAQPSRIQQFCINRLKHRLGAVWLCATEFADGTATMVVPQGVSLPGNVSLSEQLHEEEWLRRFHQLPVTEGARWAAARMLELETVTTLPWNELTPGQQAAVAENLAPFIRQMADNAYVV